MNARSSTLRLAIFGLLLSRAPRSVRVIAFMALGVLLAVAVIVLGTTAHGEAQNGQVVEGLPDEMLGRWEICWWTGSQEIFVRGADQPNDCAEQSGINFWETGNSGSSRGYCEYDRIEKVASGVYRAHAICHGQSGIPATEQWTEYTELEIIDGFLVATDIPEG
jgi:hypothetical protein